MFSRGENGSSGDAVSAQDMLRMCRDFDSSQWASSNELLTRQWEKLILLLTWSDRNISFYRKRFQCAGIKPGQISSLEEFRGIPLLSRAEIADADSNNLKTGDFPCVATRTTGTSGRKLTVWIAPDYGSLIVFPLWRRALKAGGLQPRDRYQRITYLGRGMYPTVGRTQDIELRDTTGEILAQLQKSQPAAILAIPSTLEILSLEMIRQGIGPPVMLRRIFTCGEYLTASTRNLIQTAFHCDPVDHYAATEVSSGIAWQCERREGYHVNADNLIVEILDDRNKPVSPGTVGRVVVTDLSSRPFPIIRYDIGDLASWQEEPCACGRTLPCLSSIAGREVERIQLSNGEWLTSHDIAGALYAVPDAMQFQVRQEPQGLIVVDVVMRSGSNRMQSQEDFRLAIMKTVLASARWELNPVSAIEGTLFAKRKLLIAGKAEDNTVFTGMV